MQEADNDKPGIVLDNQVGERHDRKDHQAHKESLAPADDIGERPGRHLEEYAGDCGDAHRQADGLGPGPQI